MKKIKISIISLGCARNLVDSELVIGKLEKEGFRIVDETEKSDICIINTCAFIDDAKREAIDVILRVVELKKEGSIKKVIVSGCLGQRYVKQLETEIPEVDAILGVDNFKNILSAVSSVLKDERFISVNPPKVSYSHKDPRMVLTPSHYAYIKVAEGCKNKCSYCAIYKIRGDFRSRPISSIVSEIKTLSSKRKIPELNIIAQDTTSYGIDIDGSLKIVELLKKICSIKRAHWIRLLYTHPKYFTDELIEIIAKEPSICKYIDIPIQHINNDILKRMNRKVTREKIETLIKKIRKKIPNVALRTSIIVGFPGETEKQFKELCSFIKETKFERLGCFIYSKEEETPAYNFKNQISAKIKEKRFDKIMQLQQKVSVDINSALLGKKMEVLIEEKETSEKGVYIARTEHDAPEVDGQVYVHTKKILKPGQFIKVTITDTLEYDLIAKTFNQGELK